MSDWFYAALFLSVGCYFALHCSKAAMKEYRAGVAKGQSLDYRRDTYPLTFWAIIAGNALAALLGVIFLCLGLLQLLYLSG